MASDKFVVVLLVAVTTFVASTDALRCYQCLSDPLTDNSCTDPFSASSSTETCSNGTICMKAKIVKPIKAVERYCSIIPFPLSCEKMTGVFDGWICGCDTDDCNVGHKIGITPNLTILLLVVLLLVNY